MIQIFFLLFLQISFASPEISFTIDDPNLLETPLQTAVQRNQGILEAFAKNNIKAALFVCGMRIDSEEGKRALLEWDKQGHIIAHHSYSHLNLNQYSMTVDQFRDDFNRAEKIISNYKHFKKIFRFPYLKEGETKNIRVIFSSILVSIALINFVFKVNNFSAVSFVLLVVEVEVNSFINSWF